MAKLVQKSIPHTNVFSDALNALREQIGAGASFHLDAYENPIASANGTDLPTVLKLTNEMMGTYLFHISDLLAHQIAGTPPALVKAVDLATGITLMNAIKADYNTHRASATINYNADSTNTLATADATDLASLLTLANAGKTAINAHMVSAPATGYALRAVDM